MNFVFLNTFIITLYVLNYLIKSEEYGYFFDGVNDHLSYSFLNSGQQFDNFSVQLWFRNEPKNKFSNLEQCILSQGSWQERFKLSLTGLSQLLITLRTDSDLLVDCHLIPKLNHWRWYNVAFTYEFSGLLKAYINGLEVSLSCKDQSQPIYTNNREIFRGALKGSNKAFTIASCQEESQGLEALLFRGHVASVRIYDTVLTDVEVKDVVSHWDPSLPTHPVPISSLPLIFNEINHNTLTANHGHHSLSLNYRVHGHPETRNLLLGDCELSITLTVAETKLDVYQSINMEPGTENSDLVMNIVQEKLGSLTTLTDSKKQTNLRLKESLQRYFKVSAEEKVVWQSYNEYSIRLEMLGHLSAMLARDYADRTMKESISTTLANKEKQYQLEQRLKNRSKSSKLKHHVDEAGAGAGAGAAALERPLVAVIVPATSKGIDKNMLSNLPLMKSLLPSLYRTKSKDYSYRIYLAVNAGDPVYSNPTIVQSLFQAAYQHWAVATTTATATTNSSTRSSPSSASSGYIDFKIVKVPDSLIPKIALSALFNIPALVAYAEGAAYYYIVNDDLMLTSLGWTELFVSRLTNNPTLSGLGVAGGIDTSDSVTPQIEFPFFHKTHIDIFRWCGVNPWTFRNWWEDNWLTDIYLPFSSVFYFSAEVTVKNYAGLNKPAEGTSGSADPRYEVPEGRRTPAFYRTEVEQGRKLILDYVNQMTLQQARVPSPGHHPHMAAAAGGLHSYYMDYCTNTQLHPPTLAQMPVAPHEDTLNPCITSNSDAHGQSLFQSPVHEMEVPHASYAEQLLKMDDRRIQVQTQGGGGTGGQSIAELSLKMCANGIEEGGWMWTECQRALGLDLLPATLTLPLLKGELCRRTSSSTLGSSSSGSSEGGEEDEHHDAIPMKPIPVFSSCRLIRPLRILILHNHCPLFTRYGSDKRLFHIAETLVGLGHAVDFGGAEVSGLESDDDHQRLHALGAELYSPLAYPWTEKDKPMKINREKYSQLLAGLDPDLVIMTCWFWNIPPVPELFLEATRELFPLTRILVLSDDSHADREQQLMSEVLKKEKVDITEAVMRYSLSAESITEVERRWRDKMKSSSQLHLHNEPPTPPPSPTSTLSPTENLMVPNSTTPTIQNDTTVIEVYNTSITSNTTLSDSDSDSDVGHRELLEVAPPDEQSSDAEREEAERRGLVEALQLRLEQERELLLVTKMRELERSSQYVAKTVEDLRKREYKIYAAADAIMTITDEDKEDILQHDPRDGNGHRLLAVDPTRIHTVRYGLSPLEISPLPTETQTDRDSHALRAKIGLQEQKFSGREGLIFVGNGANPTNRVALEWFLTSVFEELLREVEGLRLTIVGADWWELLEGKFPAVWDRLDIKGLLSQEEMGIELLRSRVFVSPMIASTGLNTKNVLAMSRGIPLVTTSLGASGLRLSESSADPPPLLVADDPEAFLQAITKVYSNTTLWVELSRGGIQHVRDVFGLESQAHDLEIAINMAFKEKKAYKSV